MMKLKWVLMLIPLCCSSLYQVTGQVLLKLDTPTSKPQIFAPNLISTRFNERDITFSPDGAEIYYTVFQNGFDGNIYFIKKTGGSWSLPSVASFSGNHEDLEPTFAYKGKRLYFSSRRGSNNYDIWYVERQSGGKWSAPVNLGSPINTPANEFYPSVVNDGSIYFTAAYKHGIGGEDIWYAKYENGQYQNPVPLPNVSTAADEYNAYVDPEESFIYFGSYGRSDGFGGGDLYMSYHTDGTWKESINLGEGINSDRLDYCPVVSPDGQYLFFTSERGDAHHKETANPFDIKAVVNMLLAPQITGSDIYWIRK